MIVGATPTASTRRLSAGRDREPSGELLRRIVAPAFWIGCLGLPGGALYKAVTPPADSMIGHRSPRYAAFGWAAARLDDGVNLPASGSRAC